MDDSTATSNRQPPFIQDAGRLLVPTERRLIQPRAKMQCRSPSRLNARLSQPIGGGSGDKNDYNEISIPFTGMLRSLWRLTVLGEKYTTFGSA